jgi:hypothetical protein
MSFWIQQNHGVNVPKLFVATTLEVWKDFIKSYDVCVQTKNPCHCPHGFFEPLLIPTSLWSSISMDFIIDFPPSSSYDSIFVLVYNLTKMAYFILCTKIIIGEEIAKLFLEHVFWYHSVLEDIVAYHGLQFASKFWKQFFVQILKCENDVVISFPPKMNGQIERVNQVLEQYL